MFEAAGVSVYDRHAWSNGCKLFENMCNGLFLLETCAMGQANWKKCAMV